MIYDELSRLRVPFSARKVYQRIWYAWYTARRVFEETPMSNMFSLCFLFYQLPQQLAPENTAMSFEKAVEAGSLGLEADVTIR